MRSLEINTEKLTKTAEILGFNNGLLSSKYLSKQEDNSQINTYSQAYKDSIDIQNKDAKFIFKNSITTVKTDSTSSVIGISPLNIDPDPRLKMLKYIFKEIYNIEISDNINTYDEAVSKYQLDKQPEIMQESEENKEALSGKGVLSDDKGHAVGFSYNVEGETKKSDKVLSDFMKNSTAEQDVSIKTNSNIDNISSKEKTIDVSSVTDTKSSTGVKASIQIS